MPAPLKADDYQPRREKGEIIRERHRPDWLSIALGVVSTLACMGILSLIGVSFGLLKITPNQAITEIVVKLLWLIFSVSSSSYVGGYVAGYTMSVASPTAAALNGLIVTQMTILTFFLMAWSGESPLPGLILSRTDSLEAEEGLMWWAMMLALPNLFASIFGAIRGNDRGRRHRSFLGPRIMLPLEQTPVLRAEELERPPEEQPPKAA